MDAIKIAEKIEAELTNDDIQAWHEGTLTVHVAELIKKYGINELQIWGSRTGSEPLSIIVH